MKFLKKKSKNNHVWRLSLVVAVAGIIGFGMVFAFSYNNQKTGSQTRCEGTCVALEKDKAVPDTLAVKVGDFVQFNSADGKTHDLSLGKGGEHHEHKGQFESGEFGGDEAWRVQFNDEGSFQLHDHLNPKINVLVIVYAPGKDRTIR